MQAALRAAEERQAQWHWHEGAPVQLRRSQVASGCHCLPLRRIVARAIKRKIVLHRTNFHSKRKDNVYWCDAASNLSGWQSARSHDAEKAETDLYRARRKALLRHLDTSLPSDHLPRLNEIVPTNTGDSHSQTRGCSSSDGRDSNTCSTFSPDETILHEHRSWGPPGRSWSITQECTCGFRSLHTELFDPCIPINRPPGVKPGTYREALYHARSICGNWVTILSRSQSLDPQMQHIGLGKLKRTVMNRLAVVFGAQLEENDTVLHSWINTPLGPKHMHASLIGLEMTDVDYEVGTWSGIAKMVDFSVSWFCGGKPVRALQLLRRNPKFGLAYETRVVLPDVQEGKIMLFNIAIYPVEADKAPIFVDRILKQVR